MSLSGFGVIRRVPANRPTLAAFLAWILASILDNQSLADAMFYAFGATLVTSMGLREFRKSAPRVSLGL